MSPDRPDPDSTPPIAVELEEVSVVYRTARGEEIVALDTVSWSLARGRSVAVIGRSGSGKSTLVSVISLMRRPTSGRVELGGRDTGELDDRRLAALRSTGIGVVFQAYHLDPRQPLWWNVALPWVFVGGCSRRHARQRAEDLLRRVGLDGLGERRPPELSGGQRQRTAIARALMCAPGLVVADEPTGNLDERTGEAIADLLFGLAADEGASVIVVTHDREVARRADEVVELTTGRLAPATAENGAAR